MSLREHFRILRRAADYDIGRPHLPHPEKDAHRVVFHHDVTTPFNVVRVPVTDGTKVEDTDG